MSCLCPQEVCTLLLAAHLLGDQISLLNWLGFALCLSGISLHVALKALHSRGTVASSPWLSITECPAIQPRSPAVAVDGDMCQMVLAP